MWAIQVVLVKLSSVSPEKLSEHSITCRRNAGAMLEKAGSLNEALDMFVYITLYMYVCTQYVCVCVRHLS